MTCYSSLFAPYFALQSKGLAKGNNFPVHKKTDATNALRKRRTKVSTSILSDTGPRGIAEVRMFPGNLFAPANAVVWKERQVRIVQILGALRR